MTGLRSATLAVFVFGVVLVPAAASGDDAAPTGLTAEAARALVEELSPIVEETRGLEFERPVDVAVVDDDEARGHMLERLEKFGVLEDLEWDGRAFGLLGLIPEGTDVLEAYLAFLREQAGGFYDPDSKSFYLLDDMPTAMMPLLAAHELTHALEDQHYDLDERLARSVSNDDRLFAVSAVHEGSAMLVMTAYMTRAMMSGKLSAAELMKFAEAENAKFAQLGDLPAAVLRPTLGTYLLGVGFLTRGNPLAAAMGYPVDDARRCFDDGPLSSEQILHPEKYWDEQRRDPPTEVAFPQAGRKLGRRWRLRGDGVLGELLIGPMVGAPTPADPSSPTAMSGSSWTNEAAAGWDGDRWELWTRGERAVVLLGTVWDGDADAGQFAEALAGRDDLAIERCGPRVAVLAGDAGRRGRAALESMLGSMGCPGPVEEDSPRR